MRNKMIIAAFVVFGIVLAGCKTLAQEREAAAMPRMAAVAYTISH
jgi:outer membrane murein-binding lipoprotein Lpp